MFHLRKMSTNEAPSVTSVTPINSIVFKNMYMIAEIIIFSITTFYFYRKINSLTYQLKEMDTKIQQLEKTIGDQKTFINDKMSEMSSIVTNMLRQPTRPVYQPTVTQTHVQMPTQPYTQPQASNVAPQPYTQQPPVYAQQSTYTQHAQQPISYAQPSTPQTNNTVSQTPTHTQSPPTGKVDLQPHQVNEVVSQQPPVYTQSQTPTQQYSPVIIPFEVLVVENTNTNKNTNTKMTIEEDEDDDLDKELGPELSELN